MKNAVTSILFLTVLAVAAAGQSRGNRPNGPYAIQGRLIFSSTKPPEDRIEVTLERGLQRVTSAFTDSLGQFAFPGLGPTDYQIVVHLPGYEDVNQAVTIFPNQMNTTVNIQMNPLFTLEHKRNPEFEGDDPDVVDVNLIAKKYPKKALQEYQKGLDEDKKGALDKAVAHFQQAVKIAPDFSNAWNNLGIAYVEQKRFTDGESAYHRAHELNPKSHQPLLNLAIAYIDESDQHRSEGPKVYEKYLDDAMDCLDQAIKLRPQSAMSHYYLGVAYYKSSFYEEAETALKKSLGLYPAFPGSRVMLVNLYLREKRLKDALDQIDAFLKEHPKAEERPAMEALRQKIIKGIETPGK